MSHILGFCVCAHICPHICIRICLPDRESTSRGRQGAPSWSPPSLNSKLSQFSTDPLPRSRTLPCSQNWIQIYTNGWRGGGFHIPQNGTQDLLCTSSMHLTFNRAISRILFFSLFFIFLVCIVVALPRVGDLTPQIAAGTNTLLPPCHPSYSLGVAACICCVCLNLCPDVQAAFSSSSLKGFTELISN